MTEISTALPRFDGTAIWAMLSPQDQAAIGAVALEYVINMHGADVYFTPLEAKPDARPFITGQWVLTDLLITKVGAAITKVASAELYEALNHDSRPVPIPLLLGDICRVCFCSDNDACEGGCAWAEPDLCTACKTPEAI